MRFFTLILVVYNPEHLVLQTLNSIKYQIVTYGDGIDIQLIIADDGSKDNSRNIIDCWLEDNKELFSEIVRQYPEVNVGN